MTGLDMKKPSILERFGNQGILKYKDAKVIGNEELLFLPVEILVPGGRPRVIHEKNVDKVKAKVIASAANIPITEGALEAFSKRGLWLFLTLLPIVEGALLVFLAVGPECRSSIHC